MWDGFYYLLSNTIVQGTFFLFSYGIMQQKKNSKKISNSYKVHFLVQNYKSTLSDCSSNLRGIAVRDSTQTSGVILLLEDYPYATDGLDIWVCIKKWVHKYCIRVYPDDLAVNSDVELQSWYTEIRHVGHGDRRDDPHCWLELNSVENLTQTLTTLIWIASALHASVNFGQFAYAGFAPNRPTRCREFIPVENTLEFAALQNDPEKFFFQMVPDRFTTTLGLALIEV